LYLREIHHNNVKEIGPKEPYGRILQNKFVQPLFNFIESLNRLNAIARNVKGKVAFYGGKK